MPATPIYSAISVLRVALYNALDPLTTAGVYWQRATQNQPLPYVIYQSQDAGGNAVKTIGAFGWQGLVTVKAIATTLSAAEALLAAVVPGMASLSHAGFSFVVRYERPIIIPPDGDIWQAAHQFRIFINTA